jgi:hypoxanthine phosphoribosyltransferase
VNDRAVAEVLVDERALATRVAELGGEIATAYAGGARPPLLVGVLKGCALFVADLVRAIPIETTVDFMSISSYSGGEAHSGIVRILKDLETDVTDRDVLLVEDIVDTGLTLNYLRRSLMQRGPRSLRTVALLDKAVRRIVPVPVEHRGFEIPDVFVIGYGLDWQGRYRNLRELLAVADVARLADEARVLEGRLGRDAVAGEC